MKKYRLEMVDSNGFTVKESTHESDFADFFNEAKEKGYMLFENGKFIDIF